MNTFFNDIKYAFRMMRRNPGFTVIAVLILAVAIAANTSLFSVVSAVMLRPLPYKDSHELVWIRQPGIDVTERFGEANTLIVLEGERDRMVEAATAIIPRLEALELIYNVQGTMPMDYFIDHALMLTEEKDLDGV